MFIEWMDYYLMFLVMCVKNLGKILAYIFAA